MAENMIPGYYFVSKYALERDEQLELSAALEELGLEYKQAQIGGASVPEIVEVVACWISLHAVMEGVATDLITQPIHKTIGAVRRVVTKKDLEPGTRRVAKFSLYSDADSFSTNLDVDLDHPLSLEVLKEGFEASRQAHLDYLKSQQGKSDD